MNASFNLISIVGLDQNGNCHSYVDKDIEKVTWIACEEKQNQIQLKEDVSVYWSHITRLL